MEEKKKSFVVPLALAVALFLAGLVLGFYFWGVDRKEPENYKESLRETIDYIATIEHRNENLGDRVTELETELAMSKEQGQSSADQLGDELGSLRQRIEVLQQENRQLRSAIESLSQERNTAGVSPEPQPGQPDARP